MQYNYYEKGGNSLRAKSIPGKLAGIDGDQLFGIHCLDSWYVYLIYILIFDGNSEIGA